VVAPSRRVRQSVTRNADAHVGVAMRKLIASAQRLAGFMEVRCTDRTAATLERSGPRND
jgi:hypothetical protein